MTHARKLATIFTGASLIAGLGLLAGCPSQSTHSASSPPPAARTAAFGGRVYGGRQPIMGATVVAYASSTTSGGAPTELGYTSTDSNGRFNITFSPSPGTGQVIYAMVHGGNAGAGNNSAISLMTVAGIRGSKLAPVPSTVNINELSTVASTATLKKYIHLVDCSTIADNTRTGTCLSVPGATGLDKMAATVRNLVNVRTGQASNFLTSQASTAGAPLRATLEKLNTLSSVVAGCVNSSGPTASLCKHLSQIAGGKTTAISASLIAVNPKITAKAQSLRALLTQPAVFAPTLATVPTTVAAGFWTLGGERFALVASQSGGTVTSFRIGNTSATLHTGIADSNTSDMPRSVVVSPSGRFAYAANTGNDSISAYTVGSNGHLNPLTGYACLATSNNPDNCVYPGDAQPQALAVAPSGPFLIAAFKCSRDGICGSNATGSLQLLPIGTNGTLRQNAVQTYNSGGYDAVAVVMDPAAPYVYVINKCASSPGCASSSDGSVKGYEVKQDGTLGVLGPTLKTGADPSAIAIDPTGHYLYVANNGSSNISAYSIDSYGDLAKLSRSPFPFTEEGASAAPTALAAGSQGKDLYVIGDYLTSGGNTFMNVYSIQSGGNLSEESGRIVASSDTTISSAAAAGPYLYLSNQTANQVVAYNLASGAPSSTYGTGASPASVIVDPSRHFAYVANSAGNTISAYSIGSVGDLKQVNTANAGTSAGPISVALGAHGRYAFVANNTDGSISRYAVNPRGKLTLLGKTLLPSGLDPTWLVTAPDGSYLYATVTDSTHASNKIIPYVITGNGDLNANGSPLDTGTDPVTATISTDGKYLYTVDAGGSDAGHRVSSYSIGASGQLTSIGNASNPPLVGAGPFGVTATSPGYVYFAETDEPGVGDFSIQPDGTLQSVVDSQGTQYNKPYDLAATPDGKFLYVTEQGGNKVTTFKIGSGGSQVAPFLSDADTGASPGPVAVGPNGRFVYVGNTGSGNISVYSIAPATAGTPGELQPLSLGSCNTSPDPHNCHSAVAGLVDIAIGP